MKNPNIIKAFFTVFTVVFCANFLLAQEVSTTKNFKNFNKIIVSSGINLYLSQGNEDKVLFKGSKDLIDKISVTKNNDGTLVLEIDKSGWGNWIWGSDDDVKVYVTIKQLESLTVSGGSDVYCEGMLNLGDVTVKTSGGSDIKLNLNANALKIASSGGSDVVLKGTVKYLGIAASGGSDVDAFGLIADEIDLKTSGGSDSNVYAKNVLKIAASGASDVNYKGNPSVKRISSSGASDVQKVN
ncbi:head GIN domain-containing protein [Pedobacter alpinus]|uniref:Head GIN domain-containing protein n=1 Tax=Pedobacter alpinus TaxID=1590643 RepID=A0ABW5TW04_9SPHI